MTRFHHSRSRWSAVVATTLVVGGVVVGLGSIASAGGWAVGSLDAVPAARAGQSAEVGFTILQHGVTPVDLLDDPASEVGIEIEHADGALDFFPAVGDGIVGHYVTTVEFADAGTYEWSIRMGWFAPQALGQLDVTDASGTGVTSGGAWPAVRTVMLAVTVALAVLAAADAILTRRRARAALGRESHEPSRSVGGGERRCARRSDRCDVEPWGAPG